MYIYLRLHTSWGLKDRPLDEAASVCVLRDEQSVRQAAVRMNSEPIISKNPWKRFAFDPQVLGSKAYGGKLFRRQHSENDAGSQAVAEEDFESVDDAMTLVEPPEDVEGLDVENGETKMPPRFSKMLAFSHAECDISALVAQARQPWNAPQARTSSNTSANGNAQMHRLSTRYFDLSIHAHTLDHHNSNSMTETLLASYNDVSSILFAVNLSAYLNDSIRLEKDIALFARAANDYHLWLAKIILFLDTSDLEPYGARRIVDDVTARFMQATRSGASNDRIHVVTGEADELAAGNIFAVCNESGRVQENKWAGLTKTPTY